MPFLLGPGFLVVPALRWRFLLALLSVSALLHAFAQA